MKSKILLIFISLIVAVSADLPRDVPALISLVFNGHRAFSLEEIDHIKERENIEDHHKAILLTQMFASVDDADRYKAAISVAENYIEHGDVPWVRDFLEMQRGFLLGLKGDRKQSAMVLENKLENNRFGELSKVDDFFLDEMIEKHGDLETFFHDLICSSLGFYYLDFAGPDQDPEKSYVFFSLIKMEGLRKKNLKQISLRQNIDINGFDMDKINDRINQYSIKLKLRDVEIATGNKHSDGYRENNGYFKARYLWIYIVCVIGFTGFAYFVIKHRLSKS